MTHACSARIVGLSIVHQMNVLCQSVVTLHCSVLPIWNKVFLAPSSRFVGIPALSSACRILKRSNHIRWKDVPFLGLAVWMVQLENTLSLNDERKVMRNLEKDGLGIVEKTAKNFGIRQHLS